MAPADPRYLRRAADDLDVLPEDYADLEGDAYLVPTVGLIVEDVAHEAVAHAVEAIRRARCRRPTTLWRVADEACPIVSVLHRPPGEPVSLRVVRGGHWVCAVDQLAESGECPGVVEVELTVRAVDDTIRDVLRALGLEARELLRPFAGEATS